jgi:hypothetical protein
MPPLLDRGGRIFLVRTMLLRTAAAAPAGLDDALTWSCPFPFGHGFDLFRGPI